MEKSAILMHLKDLLKAFYYIRDERGGHTRLHLRRRLTNAAISPEMAQTLFYLLSHRCVNMILGVRNMKY